MNIFVLKNTFIKVYIYHFSINIFIKTRSQSYVLETVSLSKTTFFTSTEGVYINTAVAKQLGCQTIQLSKQGERERAVLWSEDRRAWRAENRIIAFCGERVISF
jgi:hypothetical protein